jgi:acetyl-CoA synthetase
MSNAVAPNLYPPPEAAVQGAHVSGMDAYRQLCAEAEADYEGYWGRWRGNS